MANNQTLPMSSKQTAVPPYNRILLNNKKKWTIVIQNNRNESQMQYAQ